ncbi:efflux RND transporter permease subunit [Ferviditalea candida]|uniref:Efflux RND transporter permease subunit n=1 Tax=Ferviditalea candida TaxID=3108399 RepID=A0ABU5ZMV0_9BACL|nr:efflux RND transporter permease subunit [Paenibacillaceae bacterium T2]
MSLLTRFSLKNPVAVVILVILIIFDGLYASTRFKQESMPDISIPYLFITAIYPGASPREAQNDVALPIEQALMNIPGVKSVISNSASGVATITLEFGFDADIENKRSKVEEALNNVQLPAQVQRPKISKISFASGPMMYSSITAVNGTSTEELQRIVKSRIVPALQGLDGVGRVQTYGLLSDDIYIKLNAQKMKARGISFQQVLQVFQAMNLSVPAGEAVFEKIKVPVIVTGRVTSVEQLGDLVISPFPRTAMKDIAEIRKGTDIPESITRVQGQPSVAVNIIKNPDSNTVDVSERVMEQLNKYAKNSDKVKLDVIYDAAKDIKKSVEGMIREGLLGALFASLLILLFLRNVRATLIAIVSIPLSVLAAMSLLYYFTNVTLNIMTLGGMAVAVGRVVDDSIVVIENIVRRIREQKARVTKDLIREAAEEVGGAITSSTLTTIAVFAPLGLVSGIIGKIFAPFAITVVFSIAASLLVAVTVVPMLAFLFMRSSKPKEHRQSGLTVQYKWILSWSLNHKAVVLLISLLFLSSSYLLGQMVAVTFIPEQEDKFLMLQLTMPPGTETTAVDEQARELDRKLRESPNVLLSQVTSGKPKGEFDPMTMTSGASNQALWIVSLDPETDVLSFIEQIKKELIPGVPGAKLDIQELSGGPAGAGINIIVIGNTQTDIRNAAAVITSAVKQIKGTDRVTNTLLEETVSVEIRIRPEDALKFGMTAYQASALIRPILTEQQVGRIGSGNETNDLYMSLEGVPLGSLESIRNLPLLAQGGRTLTVKDIADVREISQPSVLQLRNGEDYAMITGDITDDDAGRVSREVKETLAGLKLPEGTEYLLEGSNKQIQDMMADMGLAMLVAVGMVYVVMVAAFGEGKAPLAILFSLPFALIGALLGTVIAKQPISVSSLIGMLMLIGIVVTNAIVLVDRVQHRLQKGMIIREALLESGGTRLRPILMTAIATICALLPLGLGLGEGALISTGLAVVVIGGLVTSTLLTLLIVPIMYELLHWDKVRRELRRAKRMPLSGIDE